MTRISMAVVYLTCALASGLCFAQSLDKLSTCVAMADDRARLKCYDEEMLRLGLKPAVAATRTPASAPTGTAAAAAAKKPGTSEDFGLEGQALREKKAAPEALSARV